MNVINQQRPSSENFGQYRHGPILSGGVGTMFGGSNNAPPPPLPPRAISQTRNYQPYASGYGGMTGGLGFGNSWNSRGMGIGGYSPYGAYGGYPQMYSSGLQGYAGQLGGPSGDVEDRFVQFAEESSRSAFQSIESVVRTFSSIAMMLESTHFAMMSSFRAILSVAENFGRTRNMFGEVMNTFALVRFFKWLYRKITYKLGLNPDDPSTEQVWRKTVVEALNDERVEASSSWPILVFLSLLIAIPYIVNKLMNNARRTNPNVIEDPREWLRGNEPVYSAIVLYDFERYNNEEMSVKRGEKVWLAPQSLQPKDLPGWSRASDNRRGIGLVPTNYLKIVGQLGKKMEDNIVSRDSTTLSSDNSHSMDSSNSFGEQATKETNERLFDENIVP